MRVGMNSIDCLVCLRPRGPGSGPPLATRPLQFKKEGRDFPLIPYLFISEASSSFSPECAYVIGYF